MTGQRGITLVEMMVTIVLASIIGFLVMNLYIGSSRTYTDQNRILDAQRSGRITLESMARVLRHAGLDPYGTANAGIVVATADQVSVTMDLNLDRDINDSGEQVSFRRTGSLLQRGTGAVGTESWQDLADNVSAFSIEYYGDLNAWIAAPVVSAADRAAIRSLVISVTLRDDKATGGDFERTYTTSAYCRNMSR